MQTVSFCTALTLADKQYHFVLPQLWQAAGTTEVDLT